MYKLRPYQDEMASAAIEAFGSGNPFILQAATAAGKSLVIAEIAKRLGKPVLVLQPSREILLQNYEKMMSYGLEDVKMYSASVGKKEIGNITLATIASIYKDTDKFSHFEHAIFDEVHQFSAKNSNSMYMKLFKETGIRKVCGLTATPFRLENKFFGSSYVGCIKMLNRVTKNSFFKSIVYKVEMADLIEQGYLTRPQYHTFDTDMSDLVVNTTGRDYTEESLERWSDNKLKNLAILAEELDEKHQRVLVFCSSLRQSGRAVAMLAKQGIQAEVLDGKTPKKQREDLIERFQDGRLKWVVNVGTMTTGFDCPPLDAVVLLRPTMSVPLYIQMLGRCLRLDPNNPKKEAHFYDFTDTVAKFGRAETIKVVKEEGWKDMLESEVGRLDNRELYRFEVKKDKFKKVAVQPKPEQPKEITTDYLLSLI